MKERQDRYDDSDGFMYIKQGRNILDLACCDCGLVHSISCYVKNGKVFIRMSRDDRKTSRRRFLHLTGLQNGEAGKYRLVRIGHAFRHKKKA